MTDHRTKLRAVAALALSLGAAALPGTAQAQFFGNWGGWDNGGTWDGMAPQQVRRAIAGQGFRVLAPLRRNGNVFVADVVDGRGRRERLIVAAADAQILQRFLIDDGQSSGTSARGNDADGGLVPPADIPGAGRRAVAPPVDAPRADVPRERSAMPRFGDLAPGDDDTAAPGAMPRRDQPPIRTVRPSSRMVERTPDSAGREPGAVQSTPLVPPAPRPVVAAPRPATPPPPVVASRPEPAAPAASPASQPRRLTDPLAIPGGTAERGSQPVRSVASGITGAPQPAAAVAAPTPTPAPVTPAKPADVPVAPLD